MMMIKTSTLLIRFSYCLGLCWLTACSGAEQQQQESVVPAFANVTVNSTEQAEIEVLRAQLSRLKAQAQRVKDVNDIKRLQRAYGYYMDEGLWDEVADLFSADASIEIAREGVYQGQARIRQYLYQLGGGQSGLQQGQLNEQFQLMPVVTLAADGTSAQGRWRTIIMDGQYGERAQWGEGPYENEYIKQDGVWKISKLQWFQTIMVPYEGGWAAHSDVNGGKYVSADFPPDAPSTTDYGTWPETFLPPFHFPNPVATYASEALSAGEQ